MIPENQLEELQINLIRSHSSGVGDYLSTKHVRMLMALRINVLAKGKFNQLLILFFFVNLIKRIHFFIKYYFIKAIRVFRQNHWNALLMHLINRVCQ